MGAVLLCMVLCRLKGLGGLSRLIGWCVVQVGYCQGMAFVTGIILMYLPEEPAFQVPRCRLFRSPTWCLHGVLLCGKQVAPEAISCPASFHLHDYVRHLVAFGIVMRYQAGVAASLLYTKANPCMLSFAPA